jgi:endonuclease/exonuclease/phosphatase family metal-dependent hydrolase
LLLDTASGLDADILGFQEPVAEQVDALAAVLPGHRLVGVGRDDGIRAGEWSAIFVREERLEVVESGSFWLSPTPDVPGSRGWDAPRIPRLCTWALLRERATGQRLCVSNSHWDHEGETARRHSAGMIAARLAARPAGVPAIVTGDFNCGPDSAAVRYLTGRSDTPDVPDGGGEAYPPAPRLTDTWEAAHPEAPNEGTFHGFSGAAKGRIDYILVTEGVAVVGCEIDRTNVDGRYPSDHFPVVARLRLSGPG